MGQKSWRVCGKGKKKRFCHNCQHYVSEAKKRYNEKFKKLPQKEKDRINKEKKAIEKYWKNYFTKRRGHGKQKALGGK